MTKNNKAVLKYIHTTCGGDIDVNFFTGRSCKKCKKKWNVVTFLFNLTEIRPITVSVPWESGRFQKPETTYSKWADRLPFVADVAKKLPNWPRWARILVFLAIVLAATCLIFYITTWRYL